MSAFQAPIGTRDVLAPESARWQALIAEFARHANAAGYGLVISPMFEDIGVFRRGVGEESEVVTKEMYEFEDKGGRKLALRPEGTAPVVRAFVQHHPQVPWKAWYVTPGFRYERPQAGRFRQFHQLGVEVLGTEDADLDVEVIVLAQRFFAGLGLRRIDLRVNSMGDAVCRPAYLASLTAYLSAHETELCDEHRTRWSKNPLRVLDCKNSTCIALRKGAPKLSDALCEPCATHFARVRSGLNALDIPWQHDEYLVRGLDYYMRTTFEFSSSDLDAAQNAVAGGGRYDGLAAALGGKETPGIGFAGGIERILGACDAEGVFSLPESSIDVFVVDLTDGTQARDLTDELRRAGFGADRAFDDRSLKSQLRQADRSGARLAAIVGADELASGTVTLRELRGDGDRRQESIERVELVNAVCKWLK